MSRKINPILLKQRNAERFKIWASNNRQKLRDNYKRFYWKNHSRQLEYGRNKYANMTEDSKRKYRDRKYKQRYGISIEEYDSLLSKQNGKCAICGRTSGNDRGYHFAVDHSHDDKKSVRGLLCCRCNRNLGWYEKYMHEVAEYYGTPLQYWVLDSRNP